MSEFSKKRAEEKALSRAKDEERLRLGEISAVELQRENLVFKKFRKDVIGFGPKHRPKSVSYVPIKPGKGKSNE